MSSFVGCQIAIECERLMANITGVGSLASMRFHVCGKMRVLSERFITLHAHVRFFARMHAQMCRQLGFTFETFAAKLTDKLFFFYSLTGSRLSGMKSVVTIPGQLQCKMFGTIVTFVRSFAGMNSFVCGQMSFLGECFAARLTHIRLLVRVCSHVNDQPVIFYKPFRANRTFVRTLGRVHAFHVRIQVRSSFKRFLADFTRIVLLQLR